MTWWEKKLSTTDLVAHGCRRMSFKTKLSQNLDIQNRRRSVGIPDSAHSVALTTRPELLKFSRNIVVLGLRERTAARNANNKHSQPSCLECARSEPCAAKNGLTGGGWTQKSGFDEWRRWLVGLKKVGQTKSGGGGPPPLLTIGVAEAHRRHKSRQIRKHTFHEAWHLMSKLAEPPWTRKSSRIGVDCKFGGMIDRKDAHFVDPVLTRVHFSQEQIEIILLLLRQT